MLRFSSKPANSKLEITSWANPPKQARKKSWPTMAYLGSCQKAHLALVEVWAASSAKVSDSHFWATLRCIQKLWVNQGNKQANVPVKARPGSKPNALATGGTKIRLRNTNSLALPPYHSRPLHHKLRFLLTRARSATRILLNMLEIKVHGPTRL